MSVVEFVLDVKVVLQVEVELAAEPDECDANDDDDAPREWLDAIVDAESERACRIDLAGGGISSSLPPAGGGTSPARTARLLIDLEPNVEPPSPVLPHPLASASWTHASRSAKRPSGRRSGCARMRRRFCARAEVGVGGRTGRPTAVAAKSKGERRGWSRCREERPEPMLTLRVGADGRTGVTDWLDAS